MENYVFEEDYDVVVMRFCTGNLDREGLGRFLKQARAHLKVEKKGKTRNESPGAFIVVAAKVIEDHETAKKEKSREFRSKGELEQIFDEAELLTYKKKGKSVLPGAYRPVMLWALY